MIKYTVLPLLFLSLFASVSLQAQQSSSALGKRYFLSAAYSGVGNISDADYRSASLLLHGGISLSKRWYVGAQGRFHDRTQEGISSVNTYMAGPMLRYYPVQRNTWRLALDAAYLFGNDYRKENELATGPQRRSGQTLLSMSVLPEIRLWRALYLTPGFHLNFVEAGNMDNQLSLGLIFVLPQPR